ncbi:MAG: hypothetical protein AB7F19_03320 [Candidatus Babeliales bacterium]
MDLTIIRPTGTETRSVVWVDIDTDDVGNFVIKREHAPMVLAIAEHKPITVLLTSGKQETFAVKHGGFAHIEREKVTLILHDQF